MYKRMNLRDAGPLLLSFALLSLTACAATPAAGAGDAGRVDLGNADLGVRADAALIDMGITSTGDGAVDLGAVDLGASDLGVADLGPADLGPADLGPPDLGPPDLGPPDLGPPDLGPIDMGPADAGLCAWVYSNAAIASDTDVFNCALISGALGLCYISDATSCGSCACDYYVRSDAICTGGSCAAPINGTGCAGSGFSGACSSGTDVQKTACGIRALIAGGYCPAP